MAPFADSSTNNIPDTINKSYKFDNIEDFNVSFPTIITSITAHDDLSTTSFEELRWNDINNTNFQKYLEDHPKDSNSNHITRIGTPSESRSLLNPFNSSNVSNKSTFRSSNPFGSSNSNTTSPFSSSTVSNKSTFRSSNTFGSSNSSTTSLFGSSSGSNNSTFGSSNLFGSSNTNNSTFGNSNNSSTTSLFGSSSPILFGSSNPFRDSNYQCTPDIKTIRRLPSNSGIQFTVIKKGVGSISFSNIKPSTITSVTYIDDIINISPYSICIYPNKEIPPKGTEFNVPAIITFQIQNNEEVINIINKLKRRISATPNYKFLHTDSLPSTSITISADYF